MKLESNRLLNLHKRLLNFLSSLFFNRYSLATKFSIMKSLMGITVITAVYSSREYRAAFAIVIQLELHRGIAAGIMLYYVPDCDVYIRRSTYVVNDIFP